MQLMSKEAIVWLLWADKMFSKTASFLVFCFNDDDDILSRYEMTVSASYVEVYRGKAGRSLKTPVMNLVTNGCLPNVFADPLHEMTRERAERALFRAEYPLFDS